MKVTIIHSATETALVRRICGAIELLFPRLPFKQTKELPNGLTQVYYRYSERPEKH